jgi:hypothetical protein
VIWSSGIPVVLPCHPHGAAFGDNIAKTVPVSIILARALKNLLFIAQRYPPKLTAMRW